MIKSDHPMLEFVLANYRNFNARAMRDALLAYIEHLDRGGKMFWAVAGAMSSAQLGLTLAPAIARGSCMAWPPGSAASSLPAAPLRARSWRLEQG